MATKKADPVPVPETHSKFKDFFSAFVGLATAAGVISAPFVKNPNSQNVVSAEITALNLLNQLYGKKQ